MNITNPINFANPANYALQSIQNQLYSNILYKIQTGHWFLDICLAVVSSILINSLFERITKQKTKLIELLRNPIHEYYNLKKFKIEHKTDQLTNKYHKILYNYIIDNRNKFKIDYITKKNHLNINNSQFLIKTKEYWIMINNKWCILDFDHKPNTWVSIDNVTFVLKSSLFYSELTDKDIELFMKTNSNYKENYFSITIENSLMDHIFYYFKKNILSNSVRFNKPNPNLSDFNNFRKFILKYDEEIFCFYHDIKIKLTILQLTDKVSNISLAKYDFILYGYSKTKTSEELFIILKDFIIDSKNKYDMYCTSNYKDTTIYKLKLKQSQTFINLPNNKLDNKDKDKDKDKDKNKTDNVNVTNNILFKNELSFYNSGSCCKKLEHVYLKCDQEKILLEELNAFKNEKQIYIDNGIPHTKGILLKGPPGTGKTSLIKAISHYLKRNIFMVDLKLIDTNETFNSLIERINCSTNIIVFEDIDCMNDVVLKRTENNNKFKTNNEFTLSCFLNYLDGTEEYDNRLIIMTTNHFDKLDPALVRPGRIDLQFNLTNCDKKQFIKIINKFFDKNYTPKDIDFIEDYKFSPAYVISKIIPFFSKFKKLSKNNLLFELKNKFK